MAYYYDSGDGEPDDVDGEYDEDAVPQRSKYKPEISPAAIRSIIQAAMEEEDVEEGNIPAESPFTSPGNAKKSKRYFEVKGFAWFGCPRKHHRWPSAQSWCFVDLKTQSICYRDKQKCKKCEAKAAPEFTREAIEKMAQYVVKKYLIKTGRLQPVFHPRSTDTEDTQGGPHDEERCSRCKRLGHSCWKY